MPTTTLVFLHFVSAFFLLICHPHTPHPRVWVVIIGREVDDSWASDWVTMCVCARQGVLSKREQYSFWANFSYTVFSSSGKWHMNWSRIYIYIVLWKSINELKKTRFPLSNRFTFGDMDPFIQAFLGIDLDGNEEISMSELKDYVHSNDLDTKMIEVSFGFVIIFRYSVLPLLFPVHITILTMKQASPGIRSKWAWLFLVMTPSETS